VHLVFATGEEAVVDLKDLAGRGGVFSALSDPDAFERVAVGEHGRYLEWGNGLDICADALWQRGVEEVESVRA
jgi:hypothetical protein